MTDEAGSGDHLLHEVIKLESNFRVSHKWNSKQRFWSLRITPCRLVYRCKLFGGPCCLHLVVSPSCQSTRSIIPEEWNLGHHSCDNLRCRKGTAWRRICYLLESGLSEDWGEKVIFIYGLFKNYTVPDGRVNLIWCGSGRGLIWGTTRAFTWTTELSSKLVAGRDLVSELCEYDGVACPCSWRKMEDNRYT